MGQRRYNPVMSYTSEQEAAVQELRGYYSAFSTRQVQAVLPYFHEPAVMIGLGGMFAAPTRSDLPTAIEPAMAALVARGFGRSELSIREVWSLNATTTLVTGVAIRYKLDGQELDRAGVTYVLNKVE